MVFTKFNVFTKLTGSCRIENIKFLFYLKQSSIFQILDQNFNYELDLKKIDLKINKLYQNLKKLFEFLFEV